MLWLVVFLLFLNLYTSLAEDLQTACVEVGEISERISWTQRAGDLQ